jgi:hypothetical protein
MTTTTGYDVIELRSPSSSSNHPNTPALPSINPNRFYDPEQAHHQLPLYDGKGRGLVDSPIADNKQSQSPPPPTSRGSSWDVYPRGGKYDPFDTRNVLGKNNTTASTTVHGHVHPPAVNERSRVCFFCSSFFFQAVLTRDK